MMVISPLDEEQYDIVATRITYYKLFPLILKDFLTREDSKFMMKSSNLPVNTNVTVIPGIAVQVAFPAGTGATASPGSGSGTGTTSPAYDGGNPSPGSFVLEQKIKVAKEAGGKTIEGFTSAIENIVGF